MGSSTHRAAACKDVDRLGLDWSDALSNGKAQIVEAIITTVHALAAASDPNSRTCIGRALKELVGAARHENGAVARRTPVVAEPRRYWVEHDQ